jgi:hypothetical protein
VTNASATALHISLLLGPVLTTGHLGRDLVEPGDGVVDRPPGVRISGACRAVSGQPVTSRPSSSKMPNHPTHPAAIWDGLRATRIGSASNDDASPGSAEQAQCVAGRMPRSRNGRHR